MATPPRRRPRTGPLRPAAAFHPASPPRTRHINKPHTNEPDQFAPAWITPQRTIPTLSRKLRFPDWR